MLRNVIHEERQEQKVVGSSWRIFQSSLTQGAAASWGSIKMAIIKRSELEVNVSQEKDIRFGYDAWMMLIDTLRAGSNLSTLS